MDVSVSCICPDSSRTSCGPSVGVSGVICGAPTAGQLQAGPCSGWSSSSSPALGFHCRLVRSPDSLWKHVAVQADGVRCTGGGHHSDCRRLRCVRRAFSFAARRVKVQQPSPEPQRQQQLPVHGRRRRHYPRQGSDHCRLHWSLPRVLVLSKMILCQLYLERMCC